MVTEAQKAAAEAYKTRIASENADAEQLKEETPTQRGRTFLQGLTFGTADELEAYIRSLTSEGVCDFISKNFFCQSLSSH